MNDNAWRALRGYGVGAGITVLATSLALWPFFSWALVFGILLAFLVGALVVLPVCLLLARLEQLRPWWAALLGAVVLTLPVTYLNPNFYPTSGRGVDRRYFVVMIWPDGEVEPNWGVIGIMTFGALAGLLGWAAAYGFRLRPPSESAGEA